MPSGNPCARPVACSSLMKTRSPGATVPRSLQRSRASTFPGWTHRCSAWPRPTRSSATRPRWKTSSCRRWRISRRRCASCMRFSAARVYALLFFLSGATGLVYELLWVRLLYQAFGSTIQSVTTVVALRLGLAALVLLVRTPLMGGTLPVLTRAFMGEDRAALKHSLGRLYGLNTLGAVVGTALAGFFLIEWVGIRASLWGTALVNLSIGVVALRLPDPRAAAPPADPGGQLEEHDTAPLLPRVALVLLALTAFASLLDEIAWTRVLVMIVGGSTYAFTLVLLVFLLGIGAGSAVVARRSAPASETAADAAVAQAVTAAGAGLLFVVFGVLPRYIIAMFQTQSLGATERLIAMGVAVGAVVLIPALGMGMTFPLLTDLVAPRHVARGADVGRAYALNTLDRK